MAEEMQVGIQFTANTGQAVSGINQVGSAASQLQNQLSATHKSLTAIGGVVGGMSVAMIAFGKKAFNTAARVSELKVAIDAIGVSTGLGAKAIHDAALEIKGQGIQMAVAQTMAIDFAKANIDVAQASNIARVAQDLAVIAQKDSTDTAQLLTRAITTGNSMLLKSAGITAQASEGYAAYAVQLRKNANDLTATERQQAMVNLIMKEGTQVAGVYEAAMREPGKVLRSMPRLLNEIQVSFGDAIKEGFGPAIKASYDLLKAFAGATDEGGAFRPIIDQLGIAFKMFLAPLTAGIKTFSAFITNLDLGKKGFDGLGVTISKYTPMILSLATGLSTLAGKNLLTAIAPAGLQKYLSILSPTLIGLGVLVLTNEKLRGSFVKILVASKPLFDAFMKLGAATAIVAQTVLDMAAGLADGLAGALAPSITMLANMVNGLASLAAILASNKTVVMAFVSAIAAFVIIQKAKSEFGLFGQVISGVGGQMSTVGQIFALEFKKITASSGSALTGLAGAAKYTFGGMAATFKASMMSMAASLGPMLLITAAVFVAVKVFTMWSDGQKVVKERTKEVSDAIKEQVKELGKNNEALGLYLQNVNGLSTALTGTGEQGTKLTLALHAVGLETTDAVATLMKFKDNALEVSEALSKASGFTAGQSKGMALFVTQYKGASDEVIRAAFAQYEFTGAMKAHTIALMALHAVQQQTNIADMVKVALDATSAISKETAAIVRNTKALVEAEYATSGVIDEDAKYLEINRRVGIAIAAVAAAQDKQVEAFTKGPGPVSGMIDRLKEFKAANEGVIPTVEQLKSSIMGLTAFNEYTDNKLIFEQRKQLQGLVDEVGAAKGNFDSLTAAGVNLADAIGENAAKMDKLGKSSADVAAHTMVMIDRFAEAATQANFTKAEISAIIEAMGLLDGYEARIKITLDIARFTEQLKAVVAAMGAVAGTDSDWASNLQRQAGGLRERIKELEAIATAYDTINGGMKRIVPNTNAANAAANKLEKSMDKLRTAIVKVVQDALDEAQKNLDKLKGKLDALTSATDNAIYGSLDFAGALAKATQTADEANAKIDALKETQIAFAASVADSIMNTLSFSDALKSQADFADLVTKANDEVTKANEGVVDAQLKAADAQTAINQAYEDFDNARGRKQTYAAIDAINKAILDAQKPVSELTLAQQKLADATAAAVTQQAKQISFLDLLQAQADKAKGFGAKLSQLVGLGLTQKGFEQLVAAGAEAGTKMADELIAGGTVAVSRTNALFEDIAFEATKAGKLAGDKYFDIGKYVGVEFITALAAQAKDVVRFSDKVKELLARGLSAENIIQVLNAGVEAGTKIADALLAGGNDQLIAEANSINKNLEKISTDLSKQLGDHFYATGISLGERIVAGLKKELERLADTLPDIKTVAELQGILDKQPATVAGIVAGATEAAKSPVTPSAKTGLYGSFMQAVRIKHPNSPAFLGDTPVKDAKAQFPALYAQYKAAGLALAEGGIIKSPMIRLLGEAGPEAVIPLSKMGDMGGGTTINLTVNAGLGADGRVIGDVIVNELIKYQRRNGKIPVKTL